MFLFVNKSLWSLGQGPGEWVRGREMAVFDSRITRLFATNFTNLSLQHFKNNLLRYSLTGKSLFPLLMFLDGIGVISSHE